MSATGTAQTTLIYGASGARKTTQVGYFADYIAEVTEGLSVRVVSAESAGAEPLLPYIESGGMEVLWLSRDMNPRAAIRKLSRGEWPKMQNGIPVRGPKGEMIWIQPGQPGNDLSKIGGYAVEGLTSISDICSQELKGFAASGAMVKGAVEGTGMAGAGYSIDGETFGQGSMGQVGAVQDTIMELLREMPKNLYAKSGGACVHVLFTAHESKGTDEITGQNVFGPGTVGKAITSKIFKEVGTALHLEIETTDKMAGTPLKKVGTETRVWAYYRKHRDSEASAGANISWDCKARVPATKEAHAALEQRFPGGRFELTFDQHLGTYLHFQDQAHNMAKDLLAKRRAEILAARQPPGAQFISGTKPSPVPNK